MRKELDYFRIDGSYGGYQEWFTNYMMKIGGCAAVTACDCCIYFALYRKKEKLYPFDLKTLGKEDYIRFSNIMKPYLRPRWNGIDSLDIYIDGMKKYLKDMGETEIKVEGFYGKEKEQEAKKKAKEQIDAGMPVPFLLLHHKNSSFENYVWHWFLLTGYESFEDNFMVKAVTYGSWRWLDFKELWDTGYRKKGGMIVYHM
jgi:hypothetical protein